MKTSLQTILSIIISLSAVLGIGHKYVKTVVKDELEKTKANQEGGFRYELGKEIGVEPNKIPIYIKDRFIGIDSSLSAIDRFRSTYKDMLDKETVTIDVGVKVIEGREWFLDSKGELYQVIRDQVGRGYYVNRNGVSKWVNQ